MAESRNQDLANGGPIADNYYKLLGVAKTVRAFPSLPSPTPAHSTSPPIAHSDTDHRPLFSCSRATQSTETEIRDTFHRLAVEYHPDRSGSEVDHNTAIFSKLSQVRIAKTTTLKRFMRALHELTLFY